MNVMSEQALSLKLVTEVEKYPCLYNYLLADYSTKEKTEKAWLIVAKEVNLPVHDCKQRWKNLRAVFVRHMKPVLNGSSVKSKKPYYLTEAMQFTIPFIKVLQHNPGNLPAKEEMDLGNLPVKIEMDQDEEYSENEVDIENDTSPQSVSPASPSTSHSYTQSYSYQAKKKNKREQEDADDEIFAEYVKTENQKREDESSYSQQDANKMFLLSLLPDMNQMSSSQIRKFKKKIIDYVDEILE